MNESSCSTSQVQPSCFSEILSAWDITFNRTHPEITIQGSPERCNSRIVVEDQKHQKYLLEQISKEKRAHKELIAKTLAYLTNHDTKNIISYLPNKQGNSITAINETYWQLRPYVDGIPLDRPAYVFDQWRGTVLARFLIQLYKNSIEIKKEINLPSFSLKDYVSTMINNMNHYNPREYQQITHIIEYLHTTFFPVYNTIPQRFCHGDYHPLNIIWGNQTIKAVIDWEFMGIKIEIYDMANLLGCIGIEEPTSLIDDLAIQFIKTMKQSKIISDTGWSFLFECVLALRFAWLAEWLRTKDIEMIQMEIDYLNILYKNKTTITSQWNQTSLE
ncbi:MAG: aminoglycoside phosphotransferase family protein [Thermoplasmatota archaeon]